MKRSGEPVTEITLAPLGRAHLGQLLAETLRCDPERVALLAQLVLDKTGGNPFFAIQFMFSLLDEGLLTFDHDAARWSWDLEGIHDKRYTENVVDLMLGKLTRLPAATQTALRQMSCLGNTAETAMIAVVLGTSEKQVHSDLWPAVRQELVEPLAGAYRFVHDRFQEAAYALIPEGERSAAHLRIGRLLAARTAPEAIEDNVFEIVSQLNRGAALITATTERENLAELNLLAGKRAKAATAFGMALTHFRAGDAMLAEDRWERHHGLSFALALNRAECEFLTGEHAAAKMHLAELSGHAATLPDLAAVTRLQMEPNDRDVEIALNYLRRVGINCSAQPTPDEVALEYERMWQQIGERPIEALLELPRLTDPIASGTMDVLTVLVSPAWYITDDLRRLIIARMANLSMEYGNSDASCLAYILLGTVLGPDFNDYGAGYRFAQLGLDLVERLDSDRFKARVYLGYGSWSRNIRAGRPLLRKAFDAAQQVGDFNYASFTYHHLVTHLLACGDPLAEVQREAEAGLDYARRAQVDLAVDRVIGQLQLIRTLRGLTPRFGSFDDAGFNEEQFERRLEAEPNLTHAAYWYWIRKLQARVLSDDPAAIAVAAKAEQYLWTAKALFDRVAFHFYAALAVAARTDAASAACAPHLATLAGHHRQLQEWSDICPEDFADRAALVGAEIARIEGRELDAMRLYDRAIGAARASGFVQNEAIANEFAGRFYATRGFEKIAYAYLRDARYAYLRWGADAKARQLERLFPRLHVVEDGIAAGKPGDMVQQMDVTAVVKASQAVSSEIELPKLIETLMKIALQNAGADRGLLILSRQNDFRIEAEGQSSGDDFSVAMRQAPVSGPDCPEALLRYVIRTQKTLILDDASRPSPLCEEDYVHRRHPRSILCLPLMKQGRLIGLLYFENTLATHAFTPDRVAVLELLAAQAAISLENTLLYRDLREREARIGRLVDSNIIGILFWDAEGDVSYANDAFLNMTGYTRQELVSGAIDWREMTPAEYRAHDAQRVDQLRSTGQAEPREKEFFRKDGSRVPVLIGSALLAGSDEIISFVLDLTARKQAEEKTRLLMEQAHDAILVLDQDGLVIEANRTASVMLGRPREDIVGRPLRSVADPSDELDSLLAPGSTGLVQLRLAGADGNDLDAEFSAARVSTGGQELVIVIGRDITARLRLEQQLRQAQKMDAIGQLTGGVAHDFNNLLTVITGTIEILIDGLADRPELAAIGHMIDEAAARGADLTKALLAFARKQPLQPRVTDINNLIVDTAKLLRPTLGEQVEIGSTLDPECWRALIDPSQLSTALINLAVNARDAMPAGGRITFGTANVSFAPPASETGAAEMAGDYIMVTVRDNGSGIPAAIRDKVFEPFFTTKELGKGTGLGLSMVYGFVRQSGGHIRIDSEEGQGTTISLYLPRGEQDASLSSAAPVGGPQRGNETILVVEDDALVRSYVTTQLEGLGYHTISAANGPEALALVNRGVAFDLLFTDVIMPGGMNGRELADAVSRLRPGMAILYMSGYPEAAMTQDGRLEPGVTLLNKPYRTADMARMIRQVLGSSADQDGSH